MKDLIFSVLITVNCAILSIVFAFIYSVTLNRLFLAICFVFLVVCMYGVVTGVCIAGCL